MTTTTKTYNDVRDEQFHSETEEAATFRSTWPNGNDPDGETIVTINTHGSEQAGGYILICDDNGAGGNPREAGETVYATREGAVAAALAYASEHNEAL